VYRDVEVVAIEIVRGSAAAPSLAQAVTRRVVVVARSHGPRLGALFQRRLPQLLWSPPPPTAAGAGSRNCIATLIKDTSNRHPVTVVAGLLGVGSEEWREGVAASLEVRHSLFTADGGRRPMPRRVRPSTTQSGF
jgi:hypothetical protein